MFHACSGMAQACGFFHLSAAPELGRRWSGGVSLSAWTHAVTELAYQLTAGIPAQGCHRAAAALPSQDLVAGCLQVGILSPFSSLYVWNCYWGTVSWCTKASLRLCTGSGDLAQLPLQVRAVRALCHWLILQLQRHRRCVAVLAPIACSPPRHIMRAPERSATRLGVSCSQKILRTAR